MSGFFVSNSFGHFNSETASKKFNADIIEVPGAPTTATFPQLLKNDSALNLPNITKPTKWGGGVQDRGWWSAGQILEEDNGGELKSWAPGNPSDLTNDAVNKFFKWSGSGEFASVGPNSDDYWMILYPGDAFHWKASPQTTCKFQIRYVTKSALRPQPKAYDYVVNIKRGDSTSGQSVPTACNDSAVSCFSDFVQDDTAGYVDFDVDLTGSDFMSIDVGRRGTGAGASSNIHASRFQTQCGRWSRHDDNEPQDEGIERVQIRLVSVTWNEPRGCTDSDADNEDPDATDDDGTCTYTTTPITSFTTNKSTLKVGETAVLTWVLSNGHFDEVQIIHNGSNIMETAKKTSQSQSIPVSPSTIGTEDYELKVLWNKPNAATPTEDITLNVQSAISYVPCPDPNRPTDNNGECAAGCNSGFYMDSTTGLCTQCGMDDPAQSENRNVGTDGRCGDCESGYALDATDHCVKSGCMDADDYNYDPDAVINDPSACEGAGDVPADVDCVLSAWGEWSDWSDPDTESGTRTRERTIETAVSGGGAVCESLEEIETGVIDPDTGEITITTMGGDTPITPPADDETGSPVVPIVIGVAVLGALFMMMRR